MTDQELFDSQERRIVELKEEVYRRDCDLEGANERIVKLETALSWLAGEVERDHELDRLSVDSEGSAKSARQLLAGK